MSNPAAGSSDPGTTGGFIDVFNSGTAVGPTSVAQQGGATVNLTEGVQGLNFDDGFQVYVDPADGTRAKISKTPTQELTANGAITIKEGSVYLNKGGVLAATLALPTAGAQSAGGDDGKRLRIIAVTAQAHTVTTPAAGYNGASTISTAAGAIGNTMELEARNGTWLATNLKGWTLS
jgi:hypothetical protein